MVYLAFNSSPLISSFYLGDDVLKNTGTKGAISRLKLIQAAINEFAAKGYHDAKISDIVQTAGLTQAAFYLYFPSKEAIFDEILESFIDNLQSLVNTIGNVAPLRSDQVPGQIYENLKMVFEFLGASPQLTKVALYESGKSTEIKDIISRAMADKITENQTAGKIRKDLSANLMAECIIGMVEHLTDKWLLTGEKSPETLAAESVQVVLYGVLAHDQEIGLSFPEKEQR